MQRVENTPDLSHKDGVKMRASNGYLIRALRTDSDRSSEQPEALPGQMATTLGWGWGWRDRRQEQYTASRLLPNSHELEVGKGVLRALFPAAGL